MREDVAQRDIEQLHFFAIDVDVQLRHAGAERGVQRAQAGLRAGIFDDSGYDLAQHRAAEVAAVLHLHFEAAAHAEAANCRRREGKNDRVLDRAQLARKFAASRRA